MATKFEKQIEKLLAHVKNLHQLVDERTQQLKYWQGYAGKLREERQRLATVMVTAARKVLTEVSQRYQALREENRKLKTYIEHQDQLHQKTLFQLKNQLQYALSRIDDLSLERKQWRIGMQQRQQQIWKGQEVLESTQTQLEQQIKGLEEALSSERAKTKNLGERLETAERQIEIQQVQWQELLAQKDALATRLEETNLALEIAQRTLSETLASQQSSMGREVDNLRALVISLQRQTESLHAEIALNQETIEKQERFIAVLKGDKNPNIRSVTDRKKDSPTDQEDQAQSG
jgi:chromosome segregation ATPase